MVIFLTMVFSYLGLAIGMFVSNLFFPDFVEKWLDDVFDGDDIGEAAFASIFWPITFFLLLVELIRKIGPPLKNFRNYRKKGE